MIRKVARGNQGVLIRMGRAQNRTIGPGLVFVIPFVDKLIQVPVEPFSVSLPPQSAITKDEIPIQLQASLDAVIRNPVAAAEVKDWRISVVSYLQDLMKERLEDLDFDSLDAVFASWVQSIREQLQQKSQRIGVEIQSLQISNLSPRTKPV
jgi:regulator of protease activity HflC (stomatin/prohibitin superfamily)